MLQEVLAGEGGLAEFVVERRQCKWEMGTSRFWNIS